MNAITRGHEHPQRSVDLLALKGSVERVDEESDFRTRRGTIDVLPVGEPI